MRTRATERGSILIIVVCMVLIIATFCTVSLMVATSDSEQAQMTAMRCKSLFVAQAGLEEEAASLSALRHMGRLDQPFVAFDNLVGTQPKNGAWLVKDGQAVGQYDVFITSSANIDAYTRDIGVRVDAWVPSKTHAKAVFRRIEAVVRVSIARSEVFDYVYFINNWGWYYGASIIANGNVRANGQFDGGSYGATVNAIPRFAKLEGTDLKDYIDDGGLFSGWNIVGAQNMKGDVNAVWTQADANAGHCTPDQVGKKKCQQSYQGQIAMPNLTDLTMYEQLAISKNASIKIGSTTYVQNVLGDTAGEKQNLYLVGTQAQPIVINGPVVVRGSVILSGYVTGKGAIYCKGNAYIPKDLRYVHPATSTPTSTNEVVMENWLAHNQDADALGLFARNHIVVGDYTNSSWQSYVRSWVNDWRNRSDEDSGEDLIPNTKAGCDGVLGTADDDVLESDGQWTTEAYTAAHEQLGLIPAGKHVGDAIPETGEDIDGDGARDGTTLMSEFNIPASLNSTNWAGNVPSGTSSYSSVSSTQITKVDGALYTNHTIGMLTLAYGKNLTFNGCVISRNEAIVYGTDKLVLNYDYRLLADGESHGFYLPKVWRAVEIVMWRSN